MIEGALPEAENLSELMVDYHQHRKDMAKKCYIDGEYLVFEPDYAIHLNRLNNPRRLIFWLNHLTKKTWMTVELLHWFIELVIKHFDANDWCEWSP